VEVRVLSSAPRPL